MRNKILTHKNIFLSNDVNYRYNNSELYIKSQNSTYRIRGEYGEKIHKIILSLKDLGVISLQEFLKKHSDQSLDSMMKDLIKKGVIKEESESNEDKIYLIDQLLTEMNLSSHDVNEIIRASKITILGQGALLMEALNSLLTLGFKNLSTVWLEDIKIKEKDIQLLSPQFAKYIGESHREATDEAIIKRFPKAQVKQIVLGNNLNMLADILDDQTVVLSTIEESKLKFLLQINEICNKHSVPLLLASTNNFKTKVGPFVIPGDTACLECFFHKQQVNPYIHINQNDKIHVLEQPTRPGILMTSHIATLEIFKYITKELTWQMPKSINSYLEFDLNTYTISERPILKYPRCSSCKNLYSIKPTILHWLEP
ncbi:TOMM precursor leader peptide-binding protein [Bacillus anthracis]|uniref:TOMM precursor leader peptide-binding protein n=1 Tax=Bacillus anthracis TaxID=1392 RepID=UPI003D1B81E5